MLGAFLIACGGDSATPQGPSAEIKTRMEWVNVQGPQEFVYGLKPEWRNRPIPGFRLKVGVRFHNHQNYWIQGYRVKESLRGNTGYVPKYVTTELMLNSGTQTSMFDPSTNQYTCDITSSNTILQLWGYQRSQYSYSEWEVMDRMDMNFDAELRNFKVIVDWTNEIIKFTITGAQVLVIEWETLY